MRRPPRPPNQHLFSLGAVLVALLQGAIMLLAVALTYAYALAQGQAEGYARAMAFATIVLGNLGLILANRSQTRSLVATLRLPNSALYWVIGGTLAGLLATLYVPYLGQLFRLVPPAVGDLGICLGAAVAALMWYELYKLARNARQGAGTPPMPLAQ